ncbi:MAG: hypothetical protein QF793_02065 [Candidatus Peribacteraceae bacterium]|jgi:mevalonate kinase|nr:hypothetical protein [Candidatus Peribacteraceae bacterium]|tara:strand:+ start:29011 stop:29829 length:819 start_codon:yes stop_codon:yes gene_type:complete
MRTAHASGKIILSGEYAVLFGYPGIAIPAPLGISAVYEENSEIKDLSVEWQQMTGKPHWQEYLKQIISHCGTFGGTLSINSPLPLGKGMGASTALLIAVTKCLIGEDKEKALEIEDAVNPGNSGIDFAVIWNERPIKFQKGTEPEVIELPDDLLKGALLIDTGEPDQQTPELIEWVTERKDELEEPLRTIGSCCKKLQQHENLSDIFKEHNLAQQSLGVVTDEAKSLITKIEQEGGAAKVLGAGSKTGGCGMVLAVNVDAAQVPSQYPVIQL